MTYAFHYLAVRAAPCLGINCISRYVLSCSDSRRLPLPDNVNFLRHVLWRDAAKRLTFTRLLGLHRLCFTSNGREKKKAGDDTRQKKTPHTFQKSIKVTVFICVHEVISRCKKFGVSKCLLRRRDHNPSRSLTALRHMTRIAIAPNSPDFNCT